MGRSSKPISRGVRIRRYPSGLERIEIQFSYQGVACKEIFKTLDPSKATDRNYAKNLKAEIESRIERGTFEYGDYFPNSKRAIMFGSFVSQQTVAQAQEALIADLELAGLQATTIASYRKSAKRINGMIGNVPVTALKPSDIRTMLRARHVTRKTWNNDFLPLRRALKRAVNDGEILSSPLERVDLNELVPKHQKPKPDPFSMEEIEAILAAAADYCDRFHNMIEFAFFSGLRVEEVAGLVWANVDTGRDQVAITHAAQLSIRSAKLKPPKTAAGERIVALLPRAKAALKRQRALTFFQGKNVFCRWNSHQAITSYDHIHRRWKTILVKSGVRYRSMKQTRHTYASHQLSSGENPLYVASQLGHRGTALLDVYGTWVAEWKDQAKEVRYGC